MSYNVLVLDDEKEIADLVELSLSENEFNIYKFTDSKKAIECINSVHLDMAILDIMLPDINGFEICKIIREKYNFPILMLTAKVDDVSKIKGLSIGADDYITKPFNPLELLARVKSSLRRYYDYNDNNKNDTVTVNNLVLNKSNHKCFLLDEEIDLTPIEFSILFYLCTHRGKVVSSEELFEKVWKEKYFDCNNTVMVHIKRLREKLHETPKNPKIIKTIWGIGYEIE